MLESQETLRSEVRADKEALGPLNWKSSTFTNCEAPNISRTP